MSQLIDQFLNAQKKAFSIRPAVGGFPVLAEILRQAGVLENHWALPSCQSIYLMETGSVVQQGNPLLTGVHKIPVFNQESLIQALRIDQAGKSTFIEFLNATYQAGVTSYSVDFKLRIVTYRGARGESYIESYPAAEVKN